jgi:hypothetical protein
VKHLVPDRFSLGFYALVPLSSLTTAQSFYPDQREALFSDSLHPELYGDRLTAISFVLGAGVQDRPADLDRREPLARPRQRRQSANTYVRDATNYSTLLVDNGRSRPRSTSPPRSASVQARPWLRFGGTLHSPEKFTVDTTIDGTLPSGTTSGGTIDNVFDWMPWSVDFGTEADVIRARASTRCR